MIEKGRIRRGARMQRQVSNIEGEATRAASPPAGESVQKEAVGDLVVDIPGGWVPRPDQEPLWDYLEGGGKRAVMVAHRRWGKDDVALHFTATQAMQRVGNYWHMLPQYGQARKVIWDALNPRTGKRRIDEAFPPEIRRKTREQEMFIELANGSTWQLVGSDNYNSLVGSPPVGIVFSEYAVADPMAWAYLRPILAANDGWALFIYTPRGANHGKTMLDFAKAEPGWFAELLDAAHSPVFTPETLEQERRELCAEFGETEGEMIFLQEYYCSFEGMTRGAYYAKQLRARPAEGPHHCRPPCRRPRGLHVLGPGDGRFHLHLVHAGDRPRAALHRLLRGIGRGACPLRQGAQGAALRVRRPLHAPRRGGAGAGDRHEPEGDRGEPRASGLSSWCRGQETPRRSSRASRQAATSCRSAGSTSGKCARGIAALEGYRCEYDEEKKKLADHPLHNWCSAMARTPSGRSPAASVQRQKSVPVTSIMNGMAMGGKW